jgi:hypothetical protein
VALSYFADGGVDFAIPPLRALLHIMAHGEYEGKTIHDPAIRQLFDRETVMSSDWYAARLEAKRALQVRLLHQHVASLEEFLHRKNYAREAERLNLSEKLTETREELAALENDPGAYLAKLRGTAGVEVRLFE